MTQRNFMAALDALDAAPAGEGIQFEPIGDQALEVDAEAEVAAFVDRPMRTTESEAPRSHRTYDSDAGTGRTPFSEAAGTF